MGLYDSSERSSSTKKILVVTLLLIVIAAFGVGIFFMFKQRFDSSTFRSSESTAHEKVDSLDTEGEKASTNINSGPSSLRVEVDSTRFENTYMEIDKEFMAPVAGSKKIMVIKIALMTHYGEQVFDNVRKHEFAIRSAVTELMRKSTELDVAKPNFRVELAGKIKLVIQEILVKYEDFGGVEDVFFTSFVMQ